jgi:DNA-directed RNA polymerase specialized sigma24 family protein
VAEVLRLPEGTVKSQTSRALDRLQAVLATPQESVHDH